MIRIWGRRNSVNVQKVLWCLAELGIACERRDAGLQHGHNDEDWYLARNPNGKVPLMEDGAYSLWESNTIVRHLCAMHAFGSLYPEPLRERADAERWMDWQLSTLARPVAIVFWNLIRTPEPERDLQAVRASQLEANRAFAILDRHLATHSFVAGEQFTMGDIPVGALTHRWLALPGVERPRWPALERWYARLCERPGYDQQVRLPLS